MKQRHPFSSSLQLTDALLPLEGGVEVGLEGGIHAELALRHGELRERDGRRFLLLLSPSLLLSKETIDNRTQLPKVNENQ